MNRNTQAENIGSSPNIANAPVSCRSGLYEAAIDFAGMLVYKERSHIEPADLVHDLIVSTELTFENYKTKIRGAFFAERTVRRINVQFTGWQEKKQEVEHLPCKYCKESLPLDCFRIITDKNGLQSRYTTACKKCEHIDARKRIKKFCDKQANELGDYYIKKLLTRYNEFEKVEDIGLEDIEIKRTEVLLTRISKCFKYKDYARSGRKKTKKG